ncbi:MAG: SIMPL domain-containing protein [Bacteroidales bacterium]|nr:SIMPL domain-containing protein [Bacteroidales bacterium]MBR3413369.1 SIMPL domain-containing protein [Bacteroidales bacterium]
MKRTKVIVAIIFSAAIIGAVWIGGHYLNKARGHAKTVSVVGMAERDFVSDLIVWRMSFDVLNMDMKSGYNEIKDVSKTVRDYLVSKGVSEDEIDFQAITCDKETEYHYNTETHQSYYTFAGYRLTQVVKVESNDVDKVEKISREIAELLDKGIQMNTNNLSYYYTKLSDLKIEMLAEATENARNRAETIAKSAKARLGGLQTANMGVFQITAPNSSDEEYSWGGTFNTTSKKKRASINMRLTYYVK